MAQNRKKLNIIMAFGLVAAIVVAGILFFLLSGQKDQGSIVGYWTPGNSCDQRFFELTKDFKLFQWKWEKKWDGYGQDPDANPSTYALTANNGITISGVDREERNQHFAGTIERISGAKIKISNVTVTRNNKIVKDAPSDMILTRCDENITEQIKN